MNTIPDTKVLVEAMKEAKRAGMTYFGRYLKHAKSGHFTEARQRMAYRDLCGLGYLKKAAQ